MQRTRFLVAGAGVTGLAFADRLGKEEDYLVLEALDEPGGYCRTVVRDGFVWDFSGHFFHFRHPEIERELVSRMEGQEVRTIEKVAKILHGGSEVDFPFQKNIHQLPKDDFLDCLVDLFFKAEEFPQDRAPAHFEEMLFQKFGRGIAERFLVPYNRKLYATDLRNLDVDAMGRFFPYAEVADIVRNFRKAENTTYNATFTYPEGGAIQYVRALLRGVDESRIRYETPLLAVDLDRKVATTPRGEIEFEHLVSSVPFPKLLEIAGVPYDRDVYTWNQVLVFNLGFDAKGPSGVHWTYFPDPDVVFYRVGFYDNIWGTDRMSLYVEIGLERDAIVDEALVASMRERTLADLRRTGIVRDQVLVAWHTVTLDPAYVHITRASLADVAEKRALLARHGVHSAGRYGAWTYCSIEDNLVEARELADRLRG